MDLRRDGLERRFLRHPPGLSKSLGVSTASRSAAASDGTHKLPVKGYLRQLIGKQEGDTVSIHLSERLA
jgi:hypothetical protein